MRCLSNLAKRKVFPIQGIFCRNQRHQSCRGRSRKVERGGNSKKYDSQSIGKSGIVALQRLFEDLN